MKRLTALTVCLLFLLPFLFACNGGGGNSSTEATPNATTPPVINVSDGIVDDALADISEMNFEYSVRDLKATYGTGATKIELSDKAVLVSGFGVVVDGTAVTINAAGTYVISGKLTSGSITVAASKRDKIQLVFEGVNVTNPNGPALFIQSAEKVVLSLTTGWRNTLTDGSDYSATDKDTQLDAALFSREDLTINGSGTLNVNGNLKHGIVSNDDLIITGGNLNIQAKNVGLSGKDCVKINDGRITVTAGTDGIRSDNATDKTRGFVYISGGELNITAGSDALQAETVIRMVNGTLTATANGGSECADRAGKGLKATSDIRIEGGSITVDSSDDALNSNATVYMTGGTLNLRSGDDGIHADVAIGLMNGNVTVANSYEALESTEVVIANGTVDLTSADDGINAAGSQDQTSDTFVSASGSITVAGGTLRINAGGNGMDSKGTVALKNGLVLISISDGKQKSAILSTGGTLITEATLVALDCAEVPIAPYAEGKLLLSCSFAQQAASTVSICDESGAVLIAFQVPNAYKNLTVCTAGLQAATVYTVVAGGEIVGLDAFGFAQSTTHTGGNAIATVTLS